MKQYYTSNDGGKTLAQLRMPVRIGRRMTVRVTDEEAARFSAYPKAAETPPVPPEGKIAVPTGWTLRDGAWHRTYAYEDAPPPPSRTFVTADLVEALMAEGVWEQARAWIDSKGLLDLVLATTEFDEDNANFAAGRAALQAALGWTDAEVEELLAQCVKEGA